MIENSHFSITGSKNKPIELDIKLKRNKKQKDIVIFCHGFKGFKDWGAWNLVAEEFAKKGFIFIKFNFSHNGTSKENLFDFVDLEAFSENNYSKELDDLQYLINWIYSKDFSLKEECTYCINLIGHSRGGGAVLVKAFQEKRISKICTWAAIDDYNRFGSENQIQRWKKEGVHHFMNGRTGQLMPVKFSFYEDYIGNKEILDIKNAVSKCKNELLIIHGSKDTAVDLESAKSINSWAQNGQLLIIKNTNHVFGSCHPYTSKVLPDDLEYVTKKTIDFFNQ